MWIFQVLKKRVICLQVSNELQIDWQVKQVTLYLSEWAVCVVKTKCWRVRLGHPLEYLLINTQDHLLCVFTSDTRSSPLLHSPSFSLHLSPYLFSCSLNSTLHQQPITLGRKRKEKKSLKSHQIKSAQFHTKYQLEIRYNKKTLYEETLSSKHAASVSKWTQRPLHLQLQSIKYYKNRKRVSVNQRATSTLSRSSDFIRSYLKPLQWWMILCYDFFLAYTSTISFLSLGTIGL